jgi:hypothetical protein
MSNLAFALGIRGEFDEEERTLLLELTASLPR